MAQQATVLILAEIDDGERAALEVACVGAGFLPTVEPSAEAAVGKLAAKRFDVLVVHLGTPGAALACMRARGKLLRIRIPVIALVDENDAAFARAYRAGADEALLTSRPELLAARLRALPKPSIPQPGSSRGDAVVADGNRTRAEVLERVMRDAGFRVEPAVDGFSTRLQAGRPSLKVAVVDASLDDVPALILQARAKGSRCAWVVRARPEQLEELRQKLARVERVSVVSAYGPPDDVLFEANRLIERRSSEGRSDARLLYGTFLKLRWSKDDPYDIGYSYNVSSLGLFVRTLVPPAGDKLTIEVVPPGAERSVRLDCKVVWRREFGATRKEPVPAGFGVQVIGGDVDGWAEACPRVPSLRHPLPLGDSERPKPPEPKHEVLGTDETVRPPPGPAANVAAPGDVEIRGREPMSSVEEMLASVLGGAIPDDEAVGSTPLGIDGGAVVEIEPPAAPEATASSDIDESSRETTVPGEPTHTEIAEPAPEEPASLDTLILEPIPEEDPTLDIADITAASLGFDLPEDAETVPMAVPVPDLADTVNASVRPADALVPLARVESPPAEPTTRIVETPVAPPRPESPGALHVEAVPPPEPRRVSNVPERDLRIPKNRTSPVVWGAVALVLGGAAAWALLPKPAPPSARTTSGQAARPSNPPATLPSSPAASAPATAPATALPSAAVPPQPVASSSGSAPDDGHRPGSDFDDAALGSLQKGYGFLYVTSPLATNVYIYGLLAGTTNQRITTKCGPRFIRLGTTPGAWQSDGVVEIVKCGALTRIDMGK